MNSLYCVDSDDTKSINITPTNAQHASTNANMPQGYSERKTIKTKLKDLRSTNKQRMIGEWLSPEELPAIPNEESHETSYAYHLERREENEGASTAKKTTIGGAPHPTENLREPSNSPNYDTHSFPTKLNEHLPDKLLESQVRETSVSSNSSIKLVGAPGSPMPYAGWRDTAQDELWVCCGGKANPNTCPNSATAQYLVTVDGICPPECCHRRCEYCPVFFLNRSS